MTTPAAEPTRRESDSLGSIEVPAHALYGAQTQRAVLNFHIAGRAMPAAFIHSVVRLKRAAAQVNGELQLLAPDVSAAIVQAADHVLAGAADQSAWADQFPVDVYQTGSGTSTNMNVNEVLAQLATRASGISVHPNDHVNYGQSSNDVIPSALHLSAALHYRQQLLPALDALAAVIAVRAATLADVIKTGRTHLMDAMPIRLDQELSGWRQLLLNARERGEESLLRLGELALGGTAVGTGVNTHAQFAERVIARLAADTALPLRPARNKFERMSTLDSAVEFSGHLRALALGLLKICNDLRWMNSGPHHGLNEIQLAALQPGSSIMPGKVNPVIPEACAMAMTQCVGLDSAIALAAQSGNFQLNVMLPLVADNLLTMIELLTRSCQALAGHGGIVDFAVDRAALAARAARNPILATALVPLIGYQRAAEIVKRAEQEQRPLREVAAAMTELDTATLDKLLDPARLTQGGLAD
ncbi:MAG: class II fumarate hydratase [Spongiibacteraceae bacterium]